jgi:hypothetical protein
VQAPNLVSQYEHRVAAHLSEVTQNFAGFQNIADQYFAGNVEALLLHHEQSNDRVFHDEGAVIRKLWDRLQHLQHVQMQLTGGLASKMSHLAFTADADIRRETLDGYQATVPLTADAILCGLLAGFLLGAIIEALFGGLAYVRRPRRL